MTDIIIAILSTIGALAILFASIGILRMPDFYLRLSVTVKAATLGVGLLLLCAAIVFPDVSVTTKTIAIAFFLVLTAPIAAHMIGRVAYITGIKVWKGTTTDELKGRYDEESHKLKSHLEDPSSDNDLSKK
ncbi:monovalent cation/H(+) antiporter subunit G [Sphingobacterium sp. SRCM116780]|uniref:monovalent cation/H(+) antiporter subunit G n=1 Tax=Sphingobacterium sp. SRCM116780 TaxID=2907623 RepID=UPI001F292C8E|nr:monovalent cation/H(+) antiporter subunit G [Sphingobacterium sp. SRCM116780]UIR56254.1 monovalent cation/H(+) antiporter subunit G [Sphingobacterium sp. SRCM116780]